MANLTSQEAHKLANNFFGLTVSMTDFLLEKFDTLTQNERDRLSRNIRKTSSDGQKMLAQAATLVVEESKESLTKIENTTNQIKSILKTIADIQKGINIAASVVTLSAAILSKNPEAIIAAAKGLQDTVNA
jgi:predicted translin family RNA/ssDNA-binding protein